MRHRICRQGMTHAGSQQLRLQGQVPVQVQYIAREEPGREGTNGDGNGVGDGTGNGDDCGDGDDDGDGDGNGDRSIEGNGDKNGN